MRFICFALFFIAISLYGFSQDIQIKAIAGLNLSQIDGDNMAGFNKPGLLIGGSAGIPLQDNFDVEMRLLFSMKGSRYTDTDPADFYYNLNYLDFPLLFKYHLDESFFEYAQNISLEAGLQFSYLVSAREGERRFGYINLYDDFEPRMYGFILGASYKYNKYNFRLNFQRSLQSLHKGISYIDRTISVSIAYDL